MLLYDVWEINGVTLETLAPFKIFVWSIIFMWMFLFVCLETESHYVPLAGLELTMCSIPTFPKGNQQNLSNHFEAGPKPFFLYICWAMFPSKNKQTPKSSSRTMDKSWLHCQWPDTLLQPHNCQPHSGSQICSYAGSPAVSLESVSSH